MKKLLPVSLVAMLALLLFATPVSAGVTEAKLTAAVKFKVFEEPREIERSRFGSRGGEPRAVILGDVTNDKKTDLILLVHDRIIIYPQD